jgi:hypothetical protein
MNPRSPQQIAAAQLEEFRFLHLYADRRLIAQRQYLAAARQVHRRAVRGLWTMVGLFVVLTLLAVPRAALLRVTSTPGLDAPSSGLQWAEMLAFTMSIMLYVGMLASSAYQCGRTRQLCLDIERLLPEDLARSGTVAA